MSLVCVDIHPKSVAFGESGRNLLDYFLFKVAAVRNVLFSPHPPANKYTAGVWCGGMRVVTGQYVMWTSRRLFLKWLTLFYMLFSISMDTKRDWPKGFE